MICLSVAHQSREESVSDLSFSESLSKNAFLEFRRTAIVLFLSFLNLDQCASKLVRLACLYALLRFLMYCFRCVVIQGGSDGLIRIVLLGIHSLAREIIHVYVYTYIYICFVSKDVC